jgi:hypothetical protein
MILIEQIHLTVLVPSELLQHQCDVISALVNGRDFQRELQRAIREVFRQFPELRLARISLTR